MTYPVYLKINPVSGADKTFENCKRKRKSVRDLWGGVGGRH